MEFIYNNIYTEARGHGGELAVLRTMLTRQMDAENDMCMVSRDGFFLSGLLPYAVRSLRSAGYLSTVTGRPPLGPPPPIRGDLLAGVELWDWQALVVSKCLVARRGIIAVPTGGGKTIIYGALLTTIDLPSITMVGQVNHGKQMVDKLESYGLRGVKLVGGGRVLGPCWEKYQHIVGVANTLSKLADESHPMFSRVQIMGVDEAHHMGSASTWQNVASACRASHRYALTATPFEGKDPYASLFNLAVIGLTGDVIVDMPVGFLQDKSQLALATVYMQPVSQPIVPVPHARNLKWAVARDRGIVKHPTRNNILLSQIEKLHDDPDSRTLVLVQQIAHGDMFVDELHKRGIEAVFLSGHNRVRGSSSSQDGVLNRFDAGDLRVLIGSVIFDEAVDLPQITDVVMAAGGKKIRRTRQRVGRALRGSTPVRIWDMMDMHNPILRSHSKQRRSTYESDGYQIHAGFPMKLAGVSDDRGLSL